MEAEVLERDSRDNDRREWRPRRHGDLGSPKSLRSARNANEFLTLGSRGSDPIHMWPNSWHGVDFNALLRCRWLHATKVSTGCHPATHPLPYSLSVMQRMVFSIIHTHVRTLSGRPTSRRHCWYGQDCQVLPHQHDLPAVHAFTRPARNAANRIELHRIRSNVR